jgi:hypothetical protein
MSVENSIENREHEASMRKLERYIDRYGPEAGPKLFHLLQSQAGHASVSARLRRRIAALTQSPASVAAHHAEAEVLPLFPAPVASEA